MITISIEPHPLLDLRAFTTAFPGPLGELTSPPELTSLFSLTAPAPVNSDAPVREAVRALLRHGGFKPAGRSKPASEFLIKAVEENLLSPINLAVDVCNAVSLHSGLPISVVDLDRAVAPFEIKIAGEGASYVFNASGQVMDLNGLLCLFDAEGPCANAVKDAQRTKTTGDTRRTLTFIWGTTALPDRAAKTEGWYRGLLQSFGATTEVVTF